ncbi:dynamin family protein [Acinetobacter indicus]|uniref:dynamin family protein n=1 Tax=Acinetobacter TaxID=469 RepID=UPI0015D28191|nr:dynamin family protein [Acinetobacter indicus]MDM1276312.1 dynamin family protein [Acinetobacter indicus]
MNHIEIKHNPFSIETQFFVNGQEVLGNNILSHLKQRRLQLWVNQLPKLLYDFFNQDRNIEISFIGLESDYIDLKEEIEKANLEHSTSFKLTPYLPVESVDIRLEKIKGMIESAKKNPKFLNYLQNNSRVSDALNEAFNNDFDAYVVATMSSGKSTFINAMLGTDLLPARNEATTATIAKIFDTKSEAYYGNRYNVDGEILEENIILNSDVLNSWNDQKDTHTINITGPIYGMKKRDNVRLVLTDTPGPNNSRDESHARLTMSFIQDSQRSPLILYILNATQLGINDDKNLLGLVAKEIKKGGKQARDRFIFIVNKCDEFDLEKESLEKALDNVRAYLIENGIQDPLVYPISAFATRLMRNDEQQLTKRERSKKNEYIDQFLEEEYNFIKYMPLTSKVSHKVNSLKLVDDYELNTVLKNSGIPAVEMMIDEYIEKYNLPHRLNRAREALDTAIGLALNEEQMNASLEQDEKELENILASIKHLEAKRAKGFETASYKAKLKERKNHVPEAIQSKIKSLRRGIEDKWSSITNTMQGDVSVDQANDKLEKLEDDLKFKFNEVINELDNAYLAIQKNIHKELNLEYQKYISDIFEDVKDLKIPVLSGLESKFKNFDITVTKTNRGEINTRTVVVGQKQVKTSKWYKPWSWGDTKTVNITEEREYVSLKDAWDKRGAEIRTQFNNLIQQGTTHITEGGNKIIDMYTEFLTQEFDKKFEQIIKEIKGKIQDKDLRIKAIDHAKSELVWIEKMRQDLDDILKI